MGGGRIEMSSAIEKLKPNAAAPAEAKMNIERKVTFCHYSSEQEPSTATRDTRKHPKNANVGATNRFHANAWKTGKKWGTIMIHTPL